MNAETDRSVRSGGMDASGGFYGPDDSQNLDFLMDVPLEVTIELGRTRLMIKDMMGLKKNSVIELDREANEPVDILINNKRFARGDVVIEGQKIAVAITDIISLKERIQRLG